MTPPLPLPRSRRRLVWGMVLTTAVLLGSPLSEMGPARAQDTGPGVVEPMDCPAVSPVDPTLHPMDPELVDSLGKAHRIATGHDVTVAVIDTGVSPHPRLPAIHPGGDLVGAHQQEGVPGELIDCDGHGTIVAGIIAMRPDHGSGWPYDGTGDTHIGLAPAANLIAIKQTSAFVRHSGDTGVGTLGTLADSIHRALDQGAHIINISVVSCIPATHAHQGAIQPLEEALWRAEHQGVVVVAAAGNVGQDCPEGSTVYPAHAETVLAVSARFDPHTIASYSVASDQQLLSARGLIPLGLSPRGDGFASGMLTPSGHSPFEGTSFAAPVVSGTAALLRQRHPHASPAEIRARILASVDPARGAVDPYRALTMEPAAAPVSAREVHISAPAPADDSAGKNAVAVLGMIAAVLTAIAVTTGSWWGSRRR